MSRPMQGVERILAVRLDAVGDVLMTEPALAALHASGAHVTLLTSPAAAELSPLLPSVDEVIAYEAPWMKATAIPSPRTDLRLAERLRRERYDAAVIFTVHSQSPLPAAMLCHLAGIPRRAAVCRENPYHLLSDWLQEDEPDVERHEVQRQLHLVRSLGFTSRRKRISLQVPADARATATATLRRAGVRLRQPWILLQPGASAPSRRYPPEYFAKAADRLAREDGWQVVVAGTQAEAALVDEVRSRMTAPSVGLAGELSLPELAAAVSMARMLIGNNSGPAHLAAALQTPSVILYAQTNLQHMPWLAPSRVLQHDVPCRNCRRSVCPLGHHACLRRIHPDEIVAAVRSMAEATVSDTAALA